MFCSQCGEAAEDNFCAHCGHRLKPANQQLVAAELADWEDEIRYRVLLHFPEVRDRIAAYSARASKAAMTGEQFLELADKAFQPIVGLSLSTVSSLALPIYSRLGIKTSKSREQDFFAPPGAVLVAALCSLGRRGREIKQVHQASDGCVLEATIPSDLRSFAGDLLVTVKRLATSTHVAAATKIPGQLFDWGKGQQCLNELFDDVDLLLREGTSAAA